MFFLSIHYFIGTIGVTSKYPKMSRLACYPAIDQQRKKKDIGICGRYPCVEPPFCTYLNVELAAGSLAMIAGFIQMMVTGLAAATPWVNWVIWILGHALSAFLSFLAHIMVFASYIGYSIAWKHLCISSIGQTPKPEQLVTCKQRASEHVHAVLSGLNSEALKSAVFLFGIMLLLNSLASVGGMIFMLWKRKDTSEGGPRILEDKAEQCISRVKWNIQSMRRRPRHIASAPAVKPPEPAKSPEPAPTSSSPKKLTKPSKPHASNPPKNIQLHYMPTEFKNSSTP